MLKKWLLAFAVLFCLLPVAAGAKPIHEGAFVQVGGVEQWLTIDGDDTANPVVLVLHGGPGDALSPYAASIYGSWNKHFTMVQWDQRGAGRTYGKSGPSIETSMTVEQMTRDGIEVAQYLIRRLGKRKVIIVGGSWGSILGMHMSHDRPDLFYAFIAQSVVVNFKSAVATSYSHLLQLAETANDKVTVTALESIGAPPWKTLFPQWKVYRTAQRNYQSQLVTAPNPSMNIAASYASADERKQYEEAEDFSMFHFWGGRQPSSKTDAESLTLSGPLAVSDLTALGTEFKIPLYFVEGEHDLTAPPELAKAYYQTLTAPQKAYYEVPGNGHEPSQAMIDLTQKILLERVLPSTTGK